MIFQKLSRYIISDWLGLEYTEASQHILQEEHGTKRHLQRIVCPQHLLLHQSRSYPQEPG